MITFNNNIPDDIFMFCIFPYCTSASTLFKLKQVNKSFRDYIITHRAVEKTCHNCGGYKRIRISNLHKNCNTKGCMIRKDFHPCNRCYYKDEKYFCTYQCLLFNRDK